ncbi:MULTISPECIES: hypothetical protein [Prochlorococcus]|uniref:hypothetical protein n=1 Tax=Prochlorococcus TaxID=1218 RepID=UPI0007B36B97|nr:MULTISPECIES: hypothetical protein [Prochlorococcus]KZR63596.1 hypothetical protein PMIT1312_01621 [Prochlorococcus marinus str. MIT 1312]NMP06261.1 hypothetical protein [Prochlorococcus sp. P1361]
MATTGPGYGTPNSEFKKVSSLDDLRETLGNISLVTTGDESEGGLGIAPGYDTISSSTKFSFHIGESTESYLQSNTALSSIGSNFEWLPHLGYANYDGNLYSYAGANSKTFKDPTNDKSTAFGAADDMGAIWRGLNEATRNSGFQQLSSDQSVYLAFNPESINYRNKYGGGSNGNVNERYDGPYAADSSDIFDGQYDVVLELSQSVIDELYSTNLNKIDTWNASDMSGGWGKDYAKTKVIDLSEIATNSTSRTDFLDEFEQQVAFSIKSPIDSPISELNWSNVSFKNDNGNTVSWSLGDHEKNSTFDQDPFSKIAALDSNINQDGKWESSDAEFELSKDNLWDINNFLRYTQDVVNTKRGDGTWNDGDTVTWTLDSLSLNGVGSKYMSGAELKGTPFENITLEINPLYSDPSTISRSDTAIFDVSTVANINNTIDILDFDKFNNAFKSVSYENATKGAALLSEHYASLSYEYTGGDNYQKTIDIYLNPNQGNVQFNAWTIDSIQQSFDLDTVNSDKDIQLELKSINLNGSDHSGASDSILADSSSAGGSWYSHYFNKPSGGDFYDRQKLESYIKGFSEIESLTLKNIFSEAATTSEIIEAAQLKIIDRTASGGGGGGGEGGGGGSFTPDLNGKAVLFDYNIFEKDVSATYNPQEYIDPTTALKQIGVLGQEQSFKDSIYDKEYTLQVTAQALGGYDLEGADITIGYNSLIFNDIQASDITIGAEMPIANAVLIDKGTNGDGTIRIAASSLADLIGGGDGITSSNAAGVLATINLNFNESEITTLGKDINTGQLEANPLSFTITANSDETILSKTVEGSDGLVNKSIQSLRDLGDVAGSKVTSIEDEVTLYEAAVNLGQKTGIIMGTNRTIGSDAGFTNLVRSGDTIITENEWANVGNMVANNITITGIKDETGNQKNLYAELVEGAANSYFTNDLNGDNKLASGSFIDGEYIDTAAESGTVTAAIKITGAAGNVVDLSSGIYQIQADGGAAQENTGLGSKNLITFAGDVNYDGRVSMKDIAYLNAGAARQESGRTETTGVVAAEARALDVDTNFDGEISMADLQAIDADWGKSLHSASNEFTGMSNITWDQLDKQLYGTETAGEWDNTTFKDSNALEFAAASDYVAPLDVGAAADAVGGNGPTEAQGGLAGTSTTDDIAGDFFQNPSSPTK